MMSSQATPGLDHFQSVIQATYMNNRRKLTDEKRSLRVYGSENVIARLESDGRTARLHILNYGQRPVEGIRFRVSGKYKNASLNAFGVPGAEVQEMMVDGDATEFTVLELRQYAVVDLH